VVVVFVLISASPSLGQDEGPRVYLLAPTGLNMIVPTYVNLSSDLNFSQDILIKRANINADTYVLSFMRYIGIRGHFAEVWITPIWGRVSGTAVTQLVPGLTQTTGPGLADPYIAFRIGVIGAPALEGTEFARYKQGFQLYALVGTYIPIGDYKSGLPLNLGTNRWAIRLGVPMVMPVGSLSRPVSLEVVPSVYVYTDNHKPFHANKRQQDPALVIESHLSHNFASKLWGSGDLKFVTGGETITDGVPDNNSNLHLGLGATLGYQVLKSLGLQMTYGGSVARADDSRLRMLRLRVTLTF
jgi:hypothetical protein